MWGRHVMARIMFGVLATCFWYQSAFAQVETIRVPGGEVIGLSSGEIHASIVLRLTNPSGPRFGAGIALLGHGVLVSSKDAPLIVEHIDYGSWILGVERELNIGADELVLPVTRSTVTAQNCPQLGEAVSKFHSVLDSIQTGDVAMDSPGASLELYVPYAQLRGFRAYLQLEDSASTQVIQAIFPFKGRSPLQPIMDLVTVAGECARDTRKSTTE